MKIVHFGPYAPNGCGMYEAARDMVVADQQSGHDVFFVDTGATMVDHRKEDPRVGVEDVRGGTVLKTFEPSIARYADVIVMHTGVPDNWTVKCQAPLIVVMHGRPAACFNTEVHDSNKVSYSLMAELGSWPRVKAMLTFWPSHVKYWEHIIPPNKIVAFDAPPIDESRFSKNGPVYDFAGKKGRWNVVMADAWREDIGTYEIVSGALEAAKKGLDIKFHFFALEHPTPGCWEHLFTRFRQMAAMGVVWVRRDNMEEVYRGADLVISPQRIATRSVAEPLCCGTPVIADVGCDFATFNAQMSDPTDVADKIELALWHIANNNKETADKIKQSAERMYLARYREAINALYEKVRTACG